MLLLKNIKEHLIKKWLHSCSNDAKFDIQFFPDQIRYLKSLCTINLPAKFTKIFVFLSFINRSEANQLKILNENYMVYDIFAAYNCPNDKVVYLFYEIVTKVHLLLLLILQLKGQKNGTKNDMPLIEEQAQNKINFNSFKLNIKDNKHSFKVFETDLKKKVVKLNTKQQQAIFAVNGTHNKNDNYQYQEMSQKDSLLMAISNDTGKDYSNQLLKMPANAFQNELQSQMSFGSQQSRNSNKQEQKLIKLTQILEQEDKKQSNMFKTPECNFIQINNTMQKNLKIPLNAKNKFNSQNKYPQRQKNDKHLNCQFLFYYNYQIL